MKIRIDTYVGENNNSFDTAFLQKREKWLPYTGIYLEFILKGIYDEKLDFRVSSTKESILITRHSWNRFFLNIKKSGIVHFELFSEKESLIKTDVSFEVANIEFPLLYSVPSLLSYSVSDIRFFANRLSEALVNSTRLFLFSSKYLEKMVSSDFCLGDATWKFYELIFSILTERGLVVFVSPFDFQVPYTVGCVKKLKEALLGYMERGKKFKIVWDLSSGLREKELGAIVDSVINHFDRAVQLVVPPSMHKKVGGEGFSYVIQEFKQNEVIPQNERGAKIARVKNPKCDYYFLREFTRKATQVDWGVEFICEDSVPSLRKLQYSLGRAMSQGYFDVKGEDKE